MYSLADMGQNTKAASLSLMSSRLRTANKHRPTHTHSMPRLHKHHKQLAMLRAALSALSASLCGVVMYLL